MIKSIQARPFVRPLFFWISGIVFALYFNPSFLLGGCLSIVGLILLIAFALPQQQRFIFQYEKRWIWGFVFAILLLSVSVVVTHFSERRFAQPKTTVPQEVASHIQLHFVESYDKLQLTEEEKAVLATLTLGYRKTMRKEVRTLFSAAGVSHLLAVSGFHVAIVCGFISFLLGFLPHYGPGHWLRYLLMMILLWSYVLITGLAPSATRAGLMFSFYLTGRMLSRNSDSYNTLAAAAFCMLVYNPYYLFDIGFQLSYTAVFFILFLYPRLKGCMEVRNPIIATPWNWVLVTVSAQIGTTFLCLYYFGYFSSVFIFTNLALTLIATILIPTALIWLLVPTWIPGYSVLQHIVEFLTHTVFSVADLFGSLPRATWHFRFDLSMLLVGYGILFLFFAYLIKRRSGYILSALIILLTVLLINLIQRFMF